MKKSLLPILILALCSHSAFAHHGEGGATSGGGGDGQASIRISNGKILLTCPNQQEKLCIDNEACERALNARSPKKRTTLAQDMCDEK